MHNILRIASALCFSIVSRVMAFVKRHDTTDTTDFCPRQLVMDLLRGNWCTGFWPIASYSIHTDITVKPEIFAQPLFRELDKFAKITRREYSNGNRLLSTSLIEPNTKLLVTRNAR